MYFTQADNGLALPWHGRVFVNPPYGREIRLWVHTARAEVQERRAELVAALLPARTDTLWWHREIVGSAHAVLIRGRLSFDDATPAPFPSALVVWGAGPQLTAALRREFPTAWHVEPPAAR